MSEIKESGSVSSDRESGGLSPPGCAIRIPGPAGRDVYKNLIWGIFGKEKKAIGCEMCESQEYGLVQTPYGQEDKV